MAEVEVCFARALQSQAGLPTACAAQADTAGEALQALSRHYPQLRRFVLDDQLRLRRHVNIFINDALIGDRVRLSDPLRDGDRLHILAAVSGGAEAEERASAGGMR